MTTLILAIALAHSPKAVIPLPDGAVGRVYSAKVGDNLTGCRVSNKPPAPRDVKYMLPGGLGIKSDGTISGAPLRANDYQFDVVCKETQGRFSITVNE
jgi:hypothetical protein